MMQKTFCDRCEKQCVNTVVGVQVGTRHQTADGQYLGTDEYKPIELCRDCATLLEGVIPSAFKLIRRDEPDSVPSSARFIRDEDRVEEAPPVRVPIDIAARERDSARGQLREN